MPLHIESIPLVISGRYIHAERLIPENYQITQPRPTLVFLHEALGSIRQWRDFPSLLSQATGCPALVYDRFGFGQSDPIPKARHIGYLHDEATVYLPDILSACGIQQAILIGHSDGGSIALLFAAHLPDLTVGAITEAAHVFVEEITLAGVKRAKIIYATTDLSKKLARFHGEKTASMFQNWANIWLSPAFAQWNIEDCLPHIVSPLLVIQGENDEYGTRLQVEKIVNQVAGEVSAEIIPNCAHIPHQQASTETLILMTTFINGLLEKHKLTTMNR
ncbi:alpha/beta fold hydrolase [Beggiatoa leptomitoformis]|uniref:Alpha/beta fold hydrolase n=1 Tax=Beggiatoa leptomitoformis TaxID=288004 RepID=A0A2N9YCZ4_9GAMM|nr:alpha/beta hydrolase [Beggiatoa leptomitoformis]ALG69574.2 alpha/beta fold hydrolase [Beggiatoa leptomitoformis]AUI68316.1 alpha/beta fold hydrolase [Beggiatoa leptomitoformis]